MNYLIIKKTFYTLPALLVLAAGLYGPALAAETAPRASGQAQAAPQDVHKEVAARVNGVDIMVESVMKTARQMNAKRGFDTAASEPSAEVRTAALNRLILQELAYQKARADGMTVGPEKIDEVIAALKKKEGGEEGYKNFLEKEVMTEKELKNRIERGRLLEQVFAKEIVDRVSFSGDEIRKEYEKSKKDYFTPEKIEVSDVVFFLDLHDKESLKKAEGVLKVIEADKDKDPANLTPDGTFVVREAEIKKEREEKLYEEAKKLQPDGLSGVIVTHDSIHIIKLRKYVPEKQFTFEEVRQTVEGKMRSEAQKKRLHEWEAELRKNAKVEIISTK